MRTREEMKAALQAEAEAVIEELLDQVEGEEPTLAELEDIVLRLRKRLGQRMGRVVIEGQEATRPVQRPRCPRCGQKMRYKGMKPVTAESRLGVLGLERAYYYCDRCESGLFPPG
jgi:uncharacterized coiled-coil protein SlyX